MDYRKSISIQYIIGIKIDFYRLLSQVSPCGSASGLEIHLVRTVCSNLSIRKPLAVIFFRQFEEIIQPETMKLSFYQKKTMKLHHYEAKLCILCIVSGIHNKPKSDLSRNPQHCYFSLIFAVVLDSTNKYLKHCTAQNCSKNRRICGIRNCIFGMHKSLWNPQTIIRHLYR